jgi:hypothetical protein
MRDKKAMFDFGILNVTWFEEDDSWLLDLRMQPLWAVKYASEMNIWILSQKAYEVVL